MALQAYYNFFFSERLNDVWSSSPAWPFLLPWPCQPPLLMSFSCLLRCLALLLSLMSRSAAFSAASTMPLDLFCCLVSHLPWCRSAAFLDVADRDPLLPRRVSYLSLSYLSLPQPLKMSPIATLYCLAESATSPSAPDDVADRYFLLPCQPTLFFLCLERESPSFILSFLFHCSIWLISFLCLFFLYLLLSFISLAGGLRPTSYASFQFRLFASNQVSFQFHDLCLFFSLGGSVTTRLREQLNSSPLYLVCICTFLPTSRCLVYTFSSSFRVEKRVENVLIESTSTCVLSLWNWNDDLFLSLKQLPNSCFMLLYVQCTGSVAYLG